MFFDNASTTKVDNEIISEITKLNDEMFYNAGGLYSKGRACKKLIDSLRMSILNNLNAEEGAKIVFTGSATEANNLALKGVLKKNIGKILVSNGEHPSVYNVALELLSQGYNVEFIKLNSSGMVDIEDFQNKMTREVGLISIMNISNETGAINNISDLVKIAKNVNPNVIFHSDGVQAVGKIDVDLEELGVDMYTMSAHKIHGLKGVGALYIKNGIKLKPIIHGGGQENGLRSGTENLIGIYSIAKAIENSVEYQKINYDKMMHLRKVFLDKMSNSGLDFRLNSFENNSPYIVSISMIGCRAETLLNMLDDKEIYVGNGSACSSKNSGNRILESMGLSKFEIEGNLRISFSKYNTLEEVEKLSDVLISVVKTYLSKVK